MHFASAYFPTYKNVPHKGFDFVHFEHRESGKLQVAIYDPM